MKPRRVPGPAVPLIGLALVILFFSLLHTPEGKPVREFFLTGENFRFIAAQAVVLAVGALGMTLIVIAGGIDLSAGSAVALSGVAAASVLRHGGGSADLAILAAIAAGALVGLINGSLVSGLKTAPFLVTLGMLGVVRGSARWLAAGQSGPGPADTSTIPIPETWLNGLMAPFPLDNWTFFAPGVWIALLLAGLLSVAMRYTIFGRHVFAVGSNETAARLCGVRVSLTKVLTYAAAGVFFGLAGLFQMARLRQGDPSTGAGMELEMIAAVLLGGGSLRGGSGSLLGSLAGALFMAVLLNGAQQAGWPVFTQEILVGGTLVVAAALDRLRHGRPE